MANIKAQDLPEKLTKAVKDDRVLMIDSEDYNRLKTQPAEYYRGDDGVSPTVEVIDTPPGTVPAGHTVEITDVNGKKSFFVKDGGGDMEKAVYDKNDNGIVDDAEALGGRPAEDYALKEDVQDHINTKTFYIKGESDLTTAQEIFERFKAGKNPIIIYSNVSFTLSNLFSDRVEFMASKDLPYDNSLCTPACIIYYSGNNVTQVKLRMLTAINVKTINNETILGEGNINITGGAYERPVIKINLTPDKTVYKKGATASITELKAVITKGSDDLQSVTFKKNDAVISEVTEGIKDGGEVICNCGTALNNLTENTKLTVEVNDGESVTSEIVNIEFVNPFYYGASASNIVNGTAGFTEDVSTKGNKTYAYSPNWEHNTIIYDDSYGELKDIRDDNGFSLISGFSTGTFEEGTVTYRYYAETNATNDDNVEYTYYFTEGGGGGGGGGGASIAIDTALSTTSGNPVQNKVITTAMQGKQDILESGVNIKTINGNSLLGGGNIEIQGGEENIKVFPIEAEGGLGQPEDIIHAQQAYDFLLQGGMPILVYNNKTYTLDSRNDYTVYFRAGVKREHRNDESRYLTEYILFDKQGDTVTHCSVLTVNNGARYLDTGVNYSNPYNPQYPGSPATKKYVDDSVATKQDTLVSGTNIKTINGNSLLGNGNIEIQGGTTISIDSELSDTSENPVQNKVIKQALDAKANTTDIPDVSNFATKSELPDMTEYYDKTEVDALIPDTSSFITKDVNDLTNYTTTTAMNTALDGKADKSTTYTKTEVDNLIPDISTLATKTELSTKADATDLNTKTFELASFSDLTTGQAILDWYLAGKNPLISHTYSSANISGKYVLTLSGTTSNSLIFHIPNFYDTAGTGNLAGTSSLNKTKITITFNSNNEVTSITGGHDADGYFLKADENYATPYTPLYDGSPATKKYVDDSVATKQDELVSGTNIKTVNNQSLLGNGNIDIQGGSGGSEVEMTAGENITIGTAVTTGIEKTVSQTERSNEYDLPPYSGDTITFVDFLTLNVTSALKYIKATFTQTYPGSGYFNRCQIQVLQNGIVLQTSDSFTIEYNKDTIFEMLVTVPNLIGEIQLKIGTTDTVYTYRTKYKELTLYTLSNKVYKYNPSELVTEYSGIAVETKNAGENIKIATDGNITTYSGLVPGAEYYINNDGTIEQFVGTSTVPIDTKVMAGIALSETILNINKNNPKLEVINITIPAASGTSSNPKASVTTINHNLQTTPKNILIWYCSYNVSSLIKNLSDTQGMFQYNENTGFVGLGVTEKNEKFITITNNNTASFMFSILLIA